MDTTAPSLETALDLPPGSFAEHLRNYTAKEQAECPLDATACSALVEVAANAMQTKVRDAHVIRINDGPWLDFDATHRLGKGLGFGGYLSLLEWLVEKYGAPFKGVVHWPNTKPGN